MSIISITVECSVQNFFIFSKNVCVKKWAKFRTNQSKSVGFACIHLGSVYVHWYIVQYKVLQIYLQKYHLDYSVPLLGTGLFYAEGLGLSHHVKNTQHCLIVVFLHNCLLTTKSSTWHVLHYSKEISQNPYERHCRSYIIEFYSVQ